MDLLLVRCADLETGLAADSSAGLADPHRAALSERGERHSRRLAAWLRGHAPRQLQIFSSPARGAREMAGLLAEGVAEGLAEGMNERLEEKIRPPVVSRLLGPTACASDVLGAVGWPHDHNAALVVAHQPALGALASLLLSGQEAPLAIKKGALWWFSSRLRGDDQQTVLRCVLPPDLIKGGGRSGKVAVSELNSEGPQEQVMADKASKVFRLEFPEVADLLRLRLAGELR